MLPEVKLAREAELPYAGLCFVTDYDAWHEAEASVTLEGILGVLRNNVAFAQRILARVNSWPDARESPAVSALKNAIITDPRFISQSVRERFGVLLSKYLPVEVP
jgi:5'-methylthioadenosine phosphorylase